MLELGAKHQTVGPELQKHAQPAAKVLPGPGWPGHHRMRAESLLGVALLALAQAVEVRKEGSWGPNCSPTSPTPRLEKSAPQASKRALFLGRLEPGPFCRVQCSLAGRWSLAPWDTHAFVSSSWAFGPWRESCCCFPFPDAPVATSPQLLSSAGW